MRNSSDEDDDDEEVDSQGEDDDEDTEYIESEADTPPPLKKVPFLPPFHLFPNFSRHFSAPKELGPRRMMSMIRPLAEGVLWRRPNAGGQMQRGESLSDLPFFSAKTEPLVYTSFL